jgi:hypothetical protein
MIVIIWIYIYIYICYSSSRMMITHSKITDQNHE